MTRLILVPLDGSAFGEQALPMALSLARRSGSQLHLVHVHTLLGTAYAELQIYRDDRLDDDLRRTERAYLERIRANVELKTGVTSGVALIDGEDPASALRAEARRVGADLVVMTTHARGPMGRFWLGSVADSLVRDLSCPLLLVHPTRTGGVDLNDDVTIEHLLVPLDGAPLAERILGPAADLARLTGAGLTLLRVVKPVYPVTLPAEPGALGGLALDLMDRVEKVHAALKKEAHAYLDGVARKLRSAGFTVQTLVSIEEEAGSAILERAHKPIDLIALETHGRHGLSRLLFGSTTDKVIRHTTLPILVHCSP